VRADPLRQLPRAWAAVFAGDRRVWRVAALCAVPFVLLVCLYCAQPRDYNTGTDSVEVHGFPARARADQALCVPDLLLPAGTARLRLELLSSARERPALHLMLEIAGRTLHRDLGRLALSGGAPSSAVFTIPRLPAQPAATPAAACVTADGVVSWGGTALPAPPRLAPTLGGARLSARIAVWYEPHNGARQSYLDAAGAVLDRAALFRPGWVGPWLYALLLLVVLPLLALTAVRCLALAVAGTTQRRLAICLFAIAAVNFGCWALITPPFQAPDEEDHFAYAQSLVERGQAPSRNPDVHLRRWSSAETLALEGISFFTDHRAADARPPWLASQQRTYDAGAQRLHPRADDGGGKETAATHGPIYYAALAPAYLAGGSSPFSQLTLMRLTSALIGALTVLFTFLLARELAPGRPWLAVTAALLVAYQPMYGFMSGVVNNDVGVNAGAAALELLLIRLLRRGVTVPAGALTGIVLLGLPIVKGTAVSLYPVAALVLGASLWRDHGRAALRGWLALALAALATGLLSAHILGGLHTSSSPAGPAALGSDASAVGGALANIPDFLSYIWQVFLPRLSFMTRHFPVYPAHEIFVVSGWAAFGANVVEFPNWAYVVITIALLAAIPVSGWGARHEWVWVRGHAIELAALIAMPVTVVVGFEAAYYTPGLRPVLAEVGRYVFPAIGPLAVLGVGALHAFGRRRMLLFATALLVAMIALSYASQLLTLTSYYA
jgi:hypothetical protein